MPEHLKALVVILGLAATVFAFAQSRVAPLMHSPGEFQRRRNLWIGITLSVFLSHNFWIFILLSGVLLLLASAGDRNRVGLVLFVILAVPPMQVEIPGFAGIRYLFDIDYLRLLSLAVLAPAFLAEFSRRPMRYFTSESSDRYLYLYLLLNMMLIVSVSNATGTMRSALLFTIDILIPYVVASRLCGETSIQRAAITSFVVGALVMAGLGIFEFLRSWLLYHSLDDVLGVRFGLMRYLNRGDTLRALTTAGQPIPFGYAMGIGFCLMLALRRYFQNRLVWLAGTLLLFGGLISSFSRGPWIGALVGFLVFILTSPKKGRNVAILAAACVAASPILFLTPLGDSILYPVTVESENYEYRQRLLEISFGVILANPFFGAYDYIFSPAMQELKQGQGIIDIVNTYLAVGLSNGLVGLFLFSAFFFSAWRGVYRRLKSMRDKESEEYDIGRGILAALTCILVTIFTVSSISYIGFIYFLFNGLAVAYARSSVTSTSKSSPTAARPGMGTGPRFSSQPTR